MDKFQHQCQSCGMPLEKGKKSGTEADGALSKTYCSMCYANGSFIQPEITLDEMKVVVDDALKEAGWWLPLRWMAKKQLPSLQRWKK
jgi:hypothetical protein